jgi:hypothetical protein
LKHAGLRCLQKAAIIGDSPIDRANRLFPSDVTDSTADQHLRIDFSFFVLEKSLAREIDLRDLSRQLFRTERQGQYDSGENANVTLYVNR